MSLSPRPIDPVPEQTARVAKAAFPKGNFYLEIRDQLGTLYSDKDFADMFPTRGQPAQCPWRLALVTLFQFAEGLSDRQAVEALRSRIAWKYALSLELTDAGFDASVLCEFRARLLAHEAGSLLFESLLELCRERGWLKAGGRQRWSPAVVASGPTPPMFWPRCAPLTGSRRSWRPCATRSTPWPRSLRTGCALTCRTCSRNGKSATPAAGPVGTAFRPNRPTGTPLPGSSAPTEAPCWRPSTPTGLRKTRRTISPGWARCLPSRCCAACGCKTSSSRRRGFTSAPRTTSRPLPCLSVGPTRGTPPSPRRAARTGSVTRCI